jgi:Lsr2
MTPGQAPEGPAAGRPAMIKGKESGTHFDTSAWNVHYLSMAKTVSVVVTDDLDGTPEAEALAFTFNGHSYEIDLGQKNRAKLEKSLQPFVDAGRRTVQRRIAKAASGTGPRIDRAAVRAWAIGQGLKVSERGRISAEVMSKYEAAH